MNRQYYLWLGGLLGAAVFAAMLFGFAGFRTILGVAVLFILPVLFLIRKTGLDADEKIFFSLFIGIGLFPLMVFAVNNVLPSFKASVAAALLTVAGAGLLWPRLIKRKSS